MAERGRVKTEVSQKQLRAMVGGVTVVETTRPLLVWEKPYYPTYYVRAQDVRTELLVDTGETKRSPSRGTAKVYSIVGDGFEVENAVLGYDESPIDELVGTYRVEWSAMDHWFEEDEEVFVHPRDPHKRIDALMSSRHVVVRIGGIEVANSTNPVILFETDLPARYYLPKTDVRMDLLTSTELHTECPYKGTADYWSVNVNGEIFENIAWGYQFVTRESGPIAGHVCFYNEKVDITVDGAPESRPDTIFS